MNILVAGELNMDLVLQNYHTFPTVGTEVLVDDVTLTLGSSSAICAAGLAKLGNSVTFAGRVGADSWGEMCIQALARFGVDTSRVQPNAELKTGLTVSITSSRDRALVTYLGAMTASNAGDFTESAFHGFNHLHVSSFFLQEGLRPGLKNVLAAAHGQGLTTSLDPGFDPHEEWGRGDLCGVLEEVDVFLPNEVELEGITGRSDRFEALRALANGRTLIVAKLGAEGCAALVDGEPVTTPAFRVEAVDTTGAGDSFNAGFLHAWLRKSPLRDAMRFAAACGALSTLGSGGTASQPTEEEARAFLAERAG
ncbi:MAG TPA: carbohydrate kinase family protein [Bryobacteraceae bacterium]|nr:carbohydrate kinase family protein [Bryobacteraceae bacterium]